MLAPASVDDVPKEKLEITMLFGLEGSTATEGSFPQSLYGRVPYLEAVNSESGRLPITSTGALTIRLAKASEGGSIPRRARRITEPAIVELMLLSRYRSAVECERIHAERWSFGARHFVFEPRVYHGPSAGPA